MIASDQHAGGRKLRIAVVHSFYSASQPSGENSAVRTHVDALQRWGHEVRLISTETDRERTRPAFQLRAAARVATGRGQSPREELERWRPDIVYVHNLFPNYARRWALEVDVPLVAVLHNYRPLCANGMLLRDGGVCTLCPDGRRWAGVRYACYRGSRLATLPLAWANRKGPAADPLIKAADRILMLAPLQQEVYVRAGVSPEKTVVIPNFLPDELDPGVGDPAAVRSGWVFVGRISEEKGVRELVSQWPAGVPLRIVGGGPMESEARELADGKDIEFLGRQSREDVVALMQCSRGVVFPSLWYEGLPLVYVEAMACGTPVLAVGPSVISRLVEAEGTGTHLAWEQLAEEFRAVEEAFAGLTGRCRDTFERCYTEHSFRDRLDQVHAELGLVP